MYRTLQHLLTPALVAQLYFVLFCPQLAWGQLQADDLSQVEQYLTAHFQYQSLQEEARLALAIGAPEIIRYQYFRDFLETVSLELLYVHHGTEVADYSIGPFQMKPSFVELLEKKLVNLDIAGDYALLTEYQTELVPETRRERLRRMQDQDFQLLYLKAFRYVCKRQYGAYLEGKSTLQMLQFMATAYNLGLDQSINEITSYADCAYFPFGKSYPGKQYAYGQLTVEIFNNLNKIND